MIDDIRKRDEEAFNLLGSCLNEEEDNEGKWTFDFEDLRIQCVSVFAVKAYIDSNSDFTFRDWLLNNKSLNVENIKG